MKKALTLLLVLMLSLGVFAASASADNFTMVTLDDSKDFTVVGLVDDTEDMTVKGLTATWQKVTIQNDHLIEWSTSDHTVAQFKDGFNYVNTVTGKDTVTVALKGEGRATITATYNGTISVSSYIVVEKSTATTSVSSISVEVDFSGTANDFTQSGLTVPLFSLDDVFGTGFDDGDVLKKDPSAMHALLYALELENDRDGTDDITNPDWDWDWVSANVTVTSEGTFVTKITPDTNDATTGWQYEVKPSSGSYADPGYAASIYELNASDSVKWEYKAWSW